MAGRKPLTLAHVDHLDGSERAKERLRVFLETLQGGLSIPEACQRLKLRESYFHELRHAWLQESLGLLEPKPLGRPRGGSETPPTSAEEMARLAQEAAELREQLRATQVRAEIAQILAAPELPAKKKRRAPAASQAPPR